MGDFNEVFLSSEVRGGVFNPSRAEKFLNTMGLCGFLDLGAIGNRFTWSRRTTGNIFLSKRLDRAIASCSWRSMFPEVFVENLCRLHSNHCPVLIRCTLFERGVRPFRFQAAWTTHPQFREVVHSAWDRGHLDVLRSLVEAQGDARKFNLETFGNIGRRKRVLEARIQGIHRCMETVDSLKLTLLEKEL